MKRQNPAVGDLLSSESAVVVPWHVEQLRCTNFLVPLFDITAEAAFRSFAESEPLQVSENRQQALQTATGVFHSFKLDVAKAPGRIDIILHSNQESAVSMPGVSLLGLWHDIKTLFDSGVKAWLCSNPKVQRLAFGAIVLNEVADPPAGYKILNQLLPKVDIDVEHSSDFFYQINRPRLVQFSDELLVKINRLSKWSVATVVSQTLRLSATEPVQRPQNVVASLVNYARAELDLSTDAELLELPTAQLATIWEKLVDLAGELLLKGDVP
jgi:hypothetical protein